MITFSNFGKPGSGNLGNQLFQYASMIGMGAKYGHDVALPHEWQYDYQFVGPPQRDSIVRKNVKRVNEPHFHYTPEFWDQVFEGRKFATIDILGWLQSEKYWSHCTDKVRSLLKFEPVFEQSIRDTHAEALSKETIAISIRRGDYVDNPNYTLLPIEYYITALFENFPNWRECNLVLFSDDIEYCKVHFGCLTNTHFASGNAIEQLCLMSMCDHFIIANSTFSWWGAYLGEKEHSKVIRPNYLFSESYGALNDSKDFYPARWVNFDHAGKKIDLRDVVFTVPVHYDHPDREENLDLCIDLLQKSFDTTIIVGEQGGAHFKYLLNKGVLHCEFRDMPFFHRTRMLNEMAKLSDQPIVFNWDADVFASPMQIYEAVERLRHGADMVYPYDGRFARVPRNQWLHTVTHHADLGIFQNTVFTGMRKEDFISVGGAVGFRRESFTSGGMENENFISYGPEDRERFYRFQKLGFKIERVPGVIYHMDHFISTNSSTQHKHFQANNKEFDRIKSTDLKAEVRRWEWTTS